MTKFYVGNLPNTLGEDDLAFWISSQGFAVRSAEVIRDTTTGNSRGFGFVVLDGAINVSEAIKQLSGVKMNGHDVTVLDVEPNGKGS